MHAEFNHQLHYYYTDYVPYVREKFKNPPDTLGFRDVSILFDRTIFSR